MATPLPPESSVREGVVVLDSFYRAIAKADLLSTEVLLAMEQELEAEALRRPHGPTYGPYVDEVTLIRAFADYLRHVREEV